MIHTDGRRTVANSPARRFKPAHGGYPGEVAINESDQPDMEQWSDKELLAALSLLMPGDPIHTQAQTEAAQRARF